MEKQRRSVVATATVFGFVAGTIGGMLGGAILGGILQRASGRFSALARTRISAREFVLLDASGRRRMVITTKRDKHSSYVGGVLELINEKGYEVASLREGWDEGATLVLGRRTANTGQVRLSSFGSGCGLFLDGTEEYEKSTGSLMISLDKAMLSFNCQLLEGEEAAAVQRRIGLHNAVGPRPASKPRRPANAPKTESEP